MRRILRVKHSLAFPSLSEKRAVETFFMILIVGPDGVQLIQFISSLIGGNKTRVFVLFVCLIFPSVFHENSRKNIRQNLNWCHHREKDYSSSSSSLFYLACWPTGWHLRICGPPQNVLFIWWAVREHGRKLKSEFLRETRVLCTGSGNVKQGRTK